MISLGQVVITQGVWQNEKISPDEVYQAVYSRHANGDWGEVDEEDWSLNDFNAKNGGSILSAYTSKGGVKFWVITEADRSATTVLLPDEY